ncbi:MAG: aminoacyl-tRNA hydrolase [Elusimicrobia bacterium]|nr:aminoacyl-tRNA hydrolase [Elusimicrobiota bacterium]
MALVIGLGNPGPRYEKTRHNVGFRLADRLAEGESWRDFQGLGTWCRKEGLLIGKPMTFMNESGRFVGALSRFHKIEPARVLVCFDDVALPLGRLRLRARGSSGGQKGMESVIAALGTEDIPRLRIGVGPQPPGMDAAAFVLARFRPPEAAALDEVLGSALEAVRAAAAEGLEAAMNRYNPEP